MRGRLLYGISPQEIHILDLFEGDEYTRTDVVACNEDDGKHVLRCNKRLNGGKEELQLLPLCPKFKSHPV
jgi:hypothetical protein